MVEPHLHHNRRNADKPDAMERVIALEGDVTHIKEAVDTLAADLKTHIKEETVEFREMATNVSRLATFAEQTQKAIDKMATTLEVIAAHSSRLSLLEEFRSRSEKHNAECDEDQESIKRKLNATTERTNRLYWLAGIALIVVQGFWALALHFKWV